MDSIVEAFKAAVPVLRYSLHKGECGRIGVIGGSKELSCIYFIKKLSSAIYFAGIRGLPILQPFLRCEP